jgi:3-phenylpropionate/trans-cinnamate dioxygenase ferredoxin subunit
LKEIRDNESAAADREGTSSLGLGLTEDRANAVRRSAVPAGTDVVDEGTDASLNSVCEMDTLPAGSIGRGEGQMLVKVGSVKDIAAGEMRVFDVAGTKVNVANANGQLHAFDDTCTHTGCSLARGKLTGTTVTCACHGSQFDVTSGAVLRGPAQRPERSRRVQVEGEKLLVEA